VEYYALEKSFNKKLINVVFSSTHDTEGVPVFTMGYLDNLREELILYTRRKGYDCRSLSLNMSFSGATVFLEIQTYCNHLIVSNEDKVAQIIEGYKSIIELSHSHRPVRIRAVHLDRSINSDAGFRLELLALIFVILVFMSLPWFLFRTGK